MSLSSRLKIFLFLFVFVTQILASFSVELDALAKDGVVEEGELDALVKDGVVEDGELDALVKDGVVEDGEIDALVKDGVVEDGEIDALVRDSVVEDGELDALVKDGVVEDGEIDALVRDSVVRDSKIATQTISDIESQLAAQLAATRFVIAQLEEAQKSIAEIKKNSKKRCWLALGGYVLTVCAVIAGFVQQDKMHKMARIEIAG